MEMLIGGFVAVAFFALGVAFHKWAIREGEMLKRHVSDEVGALRLSISALKNEIASKL